MKRASVFVSVGFFEGKPNGVLEAMACGCPLVVSDIAAHREFLDESSAVLANPRDALSIAKGIELCLTNPASARVRSARAREIIAQWSVERMVGRYEELYREVTTRWRELRGEKSGNRRGEEGS
jgi:glycosyltransferase involved in cell wall biosynthesis